MSVESANFGKMMREIAMVIRKYNMPKGIIFVPDRLEIVLDRIEEDKFSLSYKESFGYLPDHVRNYAMTATVQLLTEIFGLPQNEITLQESGVKLDRKGSFSQIVAGILAEILSQKRTEESEISSIVDSIKENLGHITEFYEPCWSWNENVKNRWNDLMQTMDRIMQEHPSITSEIEAIRRKYMPR